MLKIRKTPRKGNPKLIKHDLLQSCRLCGIIGGDRVPIIQETITIGDDTCFSENTEIQIDKKILDCVSIEVKYGDRLPPLICIICLDKVNDFYEFRLMCAETNIRLHKALGMSIEGPQPVGMVVSSGNVDDQLDCILGVAGPIFFQPSFVSNSSKSPKRIKAIKKETKPKNDSDDFSLLNNEKVKIESFVPMLKIKQPNKRERNRNREIPKREKLLLAKTVLGMTIKHKPSLLLNKSGSNDQMKECLDNSGNSNIKSIKKRKWTFNCQICDASLENNESLQCHMIDVHSPKILQFGCTSCGKGFTSFTDYKEHHQWHKFNCIYYICPKCLESFKTYRIFCGHLDRNQCITKIEVDDFRCTKCKQKYENKTLLITHECTAVKLNCEFCGKTFLKPRLVISHERRCQYSLQNSGLQSESFVEENFSDENDFEYCIPTKLTKRSMRLTRENRNRIVWVGNNFKGLIKAEDADDDTTRLDPDKNLNKPERHKSNLSNTENHLKPEEICFDSNPSPKPHLKLKIRKEHGTLNSTIIEDGRETAHVCPNVGNDSLQLKTNRSETSHVTTAHTQTINQSNIANSTNTMCEIMTQSLQDIEQYSDQPYKENLTTIKTELENVSQIQSQNAKATLDNNTNEADTLSSLFVKVEPQEDFTSDISQTTSMVVTAVDTDYENLSSMIVVKTEPEYILHNELLDNTLINDQANNADTTTTVAIKSEVEVTLPAESIEENVLYSNQENNRTKSPMTFVKTELEDHLEFNYNEFSTSEINECTSILTENFENDSVNVLPIITSAESLNPLLVEIKSEPMSYDIESDFNTTLHGKTPRADLDSNSDLIQAAQHSAIPIKTEFCDINECSEIPKDDLLSIHVNSELIENSACQIENPHYTIDNVQIKSELDPVMLDGIVPVHEETAIVESNFSLIPIKSEPLTFEETTKEHFMSQENSVKAFDKNITIKSPHCMSPVLPIITSTESLNPLLYDNTSKPLQSNNELHVKESKITDCKTLLPQDSRIDHVDITTVKIESMDTVTETTLLNNDSLQSNSKLPTDHDTKIPQKYMLSIKGIESINKLYDKSTSRPTEVDKTMLIHSGDDLHKNKLMQNMSLENLDCDMLDEAILLFSIDENIKQKLQEQENNHSKYTDYTHIVNNEAYSGKEDYTNNLNLVQGTIPVQSDSNECESKSVKHNVFSLEMANSSKDEQLTYTEDNITAGEQIGLQYTEEVVSDEDCPRNLLDNVLCAEEGSLVKTNSILENCVDDTILINNSEGSDLERNVNVNNTSNKINYANERLAQAVNSKILPENYTSQNLSQIQKNDAVFLENYKISPKLRTDNIELDKASEKSNEELINNSK